MPAMRPVLPTSILLVALGGCSVVSERSSLGYGDYVALSCDELGEEAVRLMRQSADRSEYLLHDDTARRDQAKRQLKLVKDASVEKGCI
jgi:hypothetical protein